MINTRRMVKNELDSMVQYHNQKKGEVKELDKLYGQAFAAKVAQEEQKHAEVDIIIFNSKFRTWLYLKNMSQKTRIKL